MPIPLPPAPSPGGYRVLHTADWHLGKCLATRSRAEEHARFLDFLLGVIHEHAVDALVVAGDIFDSPNPPPLAQKQYYDFLSRLRGAGACAAVIVAGNHDSPGHLEAPRERPALPVLPCRRHAGGTAGEDWLVPLPGPGNAPAGGGRPALSCGTRDLRVGMSGQSADEIGQRALVAGIARRYQEAARARRKPGAQRGVPVLATGAPDRRRFDRTVRANAKSTLAAWEP